MSQLYERNDQSPHRMLNGIITINIIINIIIIIIIIIITASAINYFFAAASCCAVIRPYTYYAYAAASISSSHAPDSSKCLHAECNASIFVNKTQLPVGCIVVIKTTQET